MPNNTTTKHLTKTFRSIENRVNKMNNKINERVSKIMESHKERNGFHDGRLQSQLQASNDRIKELEEGLRNK
jgi:peptidoglycan hydrolase CwlO-like protein